MAMIQKMMKKCLKKVLVVDGKSEGRRLVDSLCFNSLCLCFKFVSKVDVEGFFLDLESRSRSRSCDS